MRTRDLILLLLIADLALLNISINVASAIHIATTDDLSTVSPQLLILFNLAWIVTYLIFIDDLSYLKANLGNMVKNHIQKFVLFIALVSVSVIGLSVSVNAITFFFSVLLFLIFRFGLSLWIFYFYVQKNQSDTRPTIIIGNNRVGNQLFRYFKKHAYLGLKPMGLLDEKGNVSVRKNILGSISDFQTIYNSYHFQDVIIALPLSEEKRIRELIVISERNGVRLHIVPNYFGVIDRSFKVNTIGKVPFLNVRSIPLDKYPNRFWKRAFDLFFGVLILLLVSPLMLLIAILIKLDSRGPILYRPVRLGVQGEPFTLYKFRSMKNCDDSRNGTNSTSKNDPRVTTLGKYLRKYNLDELPQLFNVLNNEMSLIGPRPHRLHLNKTLQEKINTYMMRHLVKPGITGWAQVNGWRGPTETKLQYMGRTLHDLWYIENWNFWLDIYILFLTVFGKRSRKNAF